MYCWQEKICTQTRKEKVVAAEEAAKALFYAEVIN